MKMMLRMMLRMLLATFVPLLCGTPAFADMPPMVCDIDGNGVIDVRDVGYINANLNTSAPPTSVLADANGDGIVNATDARLCMSRCTLARCAIPPGT